MESGLLNAFHDDHYDGNFCNFETENYWSHENDTLGLQLSEALEGILPLSPMDEKPVFENEIDRRYSFHLEDTNSDQNNCLTENWKQDSNRKQYLESEYQPHMSSPSIEIIAVDPNCDYSSPISSNSGEDSDEEYCDLDYEDAEVLQCSSRASKRTMSSSIADYESHTSDDSDNDNEIIDDNCILYNGMHEHEEQHNTEFPFQIEEQFNNRSLLLTPLESERVPLIGRKSDGLNSLEVEIVDMKHFDLASFITRDDYGFAINSSIDENRRILDEERIRADETSNSSIDPEDDIIVDVETVQDDSELMFHGNLADVENNDLNYSFTTHIEDDPVKDPSWSPTSKTSKTTKCLKFRNRNVSKNTISGNIKTLAVNKLEGTVGIKTSTSKKFSNCEQKRRNVGLGLGKNISMCSKPELKDASEPDEENGYDYDSGEDNKFQTIQEGKKEVEQICQKVSVKNEINYQLNNKVVTLKSPTKKYGPQKPAASAKCPKRAIEVEIRGNELIEVQRKGSRNELIRSPSTSEKDVNSSEPTNNKNCNGSKPFNNEIQLESIIPPPKKKLNLEEYKRRREKNILGLGNISSNLCKNGINGQTNMSEIKIEDPKADIKFSSQSNVSKSILPKDEVCQIKIEKDKEVSQVIIEPQFYDPIIEAKNKVFRLQELKKAARTKLIDSTVSAKVGPITKILPLEEIVRKTSTAKTINNNTSLKFNPDYEEIIIVSAGCNTDISLSPIDHIEEQVKTCNDSSKAFLQSNALLHNINNTLEKAKSSENIKISSNSLISSIQDVVLKKSTPTSQKTNIHVLNPTDVANLPHALQPLVLIRENTQARTHSAVVSEGNHVVLEHGEDKVIMHLRKDRIRPKMQTVSVQTNPLAEFPALERIIPISSVKEPKSSVTIEKRHRRQYRSRRASYSSDENNYRSQIRSREDSLSSQSSRDSGTSKGNRRYSRNQNRHHSKSRSRKHSYRSRSRSKSKVEKKLRKNRSASSCSECSYSSSSSSCSSRSGSYSSRSSRSRSRSTSYRSSGYRSERRHYDRHVSPAVEERRIVYVGRIEPDTSKEDLKRKFVPYGPIRQVTIHYKDTGMKYGFVTFERAQDAFAAIDNGIRDPKISMYDISFGGRRAFCQSSYSDLDGAATATLKVCSYPSVVKKPVAEESFEDLLKAVKDRMRDAKSGGPSRTKT